MLAGPCALRPPQAGFRLRSPAAVGQVSCRYRLSNVHHVSRSCRGAYFLRTSTLCTQVEKVVFHVLL